MIYLLYFVPFIIIAVGYVYFSGKEGREEKQMLKSMSEEEKREYFKEKNKVLTAQQKAIAAKGAIRSGGDMRL